jgi:hypothetical protein
VNVVQTLLAPLSGLVSRRGETLYGLAGFSQDCERLPVVVLLSETELPPPTTPVPKLEFPGPEARKGLFRVKQKRHGEDQVIPKLRRADVELGKGLKFPEVCKLLEITEQTYIGRWTATCKRSIWTWCVNSLQPCIASAASGALKYDLPVARTTIFFSEDSTVRTGRRCVNRYCSTMKCGLSITSATPVATCLRFRQTHTNWLTLTFYGCATTSSMPARRPRYCRRIGTKLRLQERDATGTTAGIAYCAATRYRARAAASLPCLHQSSLVVAEIFAEIHPIEHRVVSFPDRASQRAFGISILIELHKPAVSPNDRKRRVGQNIVVEEIG